MARTARKTSALGIYHVMLRGIDRQRIFEDHQDYEKFLLLLKKYKEISGFDLYAWCLMHNHVHLLLREGTESMNLIFRRFLTSFVYWYNAKYKRIGHLFGDRYKSEPVEDESYFLTVVRYIHLNPVKAGLCRSPEEYPYSSYSGYFLGKGSINSDMILSLITREEFWKYHKAKNDDICLDLDECPSNRMTDEQAANLFEEQFSGMKITDIRQLPDGRKIRAVQFLRDAGVSFRQISRLTGLSLGLVRTYSQKED